MQLGSDFWRKMVRTVRCIGSQAAAVEGRAGDDAIRVMSGRPQHHCAAHAICAY
jgi:hypothetical protein